MRFLLVLSDAFDALRAYRGRVALALAVIAILGVLVAVYLPLINGQRDTPQPLAPHGTSAQGPVEPARVETASTPTPAPTSTAEATPAPSAEATPAPEPTPAPATAPAASPAPAPAPAQSPPPAAKAAPTPAPPATPTHPAAAAGPQQVFRVQVGAFRDMAHARSLSQRLTRSGFPTRVIPGTTADGTAIYRVRTQQALTKEEAHQLVARLRQRLPALRPILVASGTKG